MLKKKNKSTVLYSGLLSFKDSALIKFYLTEDILVLSNQLITSSSLLLNQHGSNPVEVENNDVQ